MSRPRSDAQAPAPRWWRWVVSALAVAALLLLLLPRIVPMIRLQQLYKSPTPQRLAKANTVAINGHTFTLDSQVETPWYVHPGDSIKVNFWVHGHEGAELATLIPLKLRKAATCHIFAPAFDSVKINGPWSPNISDLTCDWAMATDRVGSRTVVLQMTIDQQNITQAVAIQVGPDPLDPAFLTTVFGAAAAVVALVLQLLLVKRTDGAEGPLKAK